MLLLGMGVASSPYSASADVGPGSALAACGVASAAIYFPGFHRSVDNDRFWGRGWTEWTHLRSLEYDELTQKAAQHPANYYDIWDDGQTLRRQASQAREAGLSAFVFYHYWFGKGRTALTRPLEDAILGGNGSGIGINFFFSWANEPWNRRWNGRSDGEILIPQIYGSQSEWIAHFDWLARWFHHPDYLKREGRPVFALYNVMTFSEGQDADYIPPSVCLGQAAPSGTSCNAGSAVAPFGCAGAQLYLRWYPDLLELGISQQNAYLYHLKSGGRIGRDWPLVNPCDTSKPPAGDVLEQMLRVWQERARQIGFPGIYIIGTVGGAGDADQVADLPASSGMSAMMQFLPHPFGWLPEALEEIDALCPGVNNVWKMAWRQPLDVPPPTCQCLLDAIGTRANLPGLVPSSHKWDVVRGAFATWSNFPRHAKVQCPNGTAGCYRGTAYCSDISAPAFQRLVQSQLQHAVADAGGSRGCSWQSAAASTSWRQLVVINSWNEWGEQAAIEPTVEDGDLLLRAHRAAVAAVEKELQLCANSSSRLLNPSCQMRRSSTQQAGPRRRCEQCGSSLVNGVVDWNCCHPGGSWDGSCGEKKAGFQHTWGQGFIACVRYGRQQKRVNK